MNLFATSPAWLVFLLACLTIAAAIQDALDLKISNLLSGGVLAGAVVAAILAGLEVRLWQNVASFGLILSAGVLLFSRGMLGGGDVKLLAAVGLWSDLATTLNLLAATFICGGVVAISMLSPRLFGSSRRSSRTKSGLGGGVPYGVAIAAGSFFVITVSRLQA